MESWDGYKLAEADRPSLPSFVSFSLSEFCWFKGLTSNKIIKDSEKKSALRLRILFESPKSIPKSKKRAPYL